MSYPFKEIESKWQKIWEEKKIYEARDDFSKEKIYILIEFPYPSAQGLHVGHPRSYTALDILARKRRMEGFNVLYPIGFDSFGLPAENYAIKTGINPKKSTDDNINNFKRQLKALGLSFDWSREVRTSDPDYYKWTQWIFLRLFKKGLAYKSDMPINWCTSCKVGLANEEVVNNRCERCEGEVIKKQRKQWMLKITEYADRLISDLDNVDYLEKIKAQQINWIGKSYGAEIDFPVKDTDKIIKIFTSRADTIFGATYMVLSPEHPLVEELSGMITNYEEVKEYRDRAANKSDFERTEMSKDKTGVQLKGIHAINPANNKEITLWISDYILMSYGTGAIMGVPAHDTRDYEFAKKFNLPVVEVIAGGDIEKEAYTDTDEGILVNSDFLNGLSVKDAIEKMIVWLEEKHLGGSKVNYKLRDWVFSRQRYWGEPIPLVECKKCGFVPVPEEELPVVLPEVDNFIPPASGETVLSSVKEWVNTTCPNCRGEAKRETDIMPQWAGSSWYFLRYVDPKNDSEFASREKLDYWMPVDWYNGGMEHTTLHLLYSRFWHKFLYDEGLLSCSEPYKKRTSHGMILGSDGEKMSKSRGNVVNPDDIVNEFGADTFRVYEMFMGVFDQVSFWDQNGVIGVYKFLNRVWNLMEKVDRETEINEENLRIIHKTVKKVGERIEKMKYNTAVSEIMTYTNHLTSMKKIPVKMMEILTVLLYPFAPHIACEIWEKVVDDKKLVAEQPWPSYDENLAKDTVITISIQVNGKLRGTIEVEPGVDKDTLVGMALEMERVKKFTGDKTIRKTIYVPDRLLNIVV